MKQLFGIILIILTFFTSSCDKNLQDTTDFAGLVLLYPSYQPIKNIKVILKRMNTLFYDSLTNIDSVVTNNEGGYKFEYKKNSKELYSIEINDSKYTALLTSNYDNPIIDQSSINYDTIFICEKSFLKIEFLKTSSNPLDSIWCHITSGYLHFNNVVIFGFREYYFIPNQSDSATFFELPYDVFKQTKINWKVYNNSDQINESADVTLSPADTLVYRLEY
jgi:hypothetical protein